MPYIGNITQDFNVSNAMLDTDSVTSIKIVDGTIEGADIAANLDLSDSQKIRFGAGNDLQIYHDGSDSYISEGGTGLLKILSSGVGIKNAADSQFMAFFGSTGASELYFNGSKKLETTSEGIDVDKAVTIDGSTPELRMKVTADAQSHRIRFFNTADSQVARIYGDPSTGDLSLQTGANGAEEAVKAKSNGAVELYYDNSKKFETDSLGTVITGRVLFGDSSGVNDHRIKFGDSGDLQIYHDGSNSYINDLGTGNLLLVTNGAELQLLGAGGGDFMVKAVSNGAVELYHDNSKKFETTSDGVKISGAEGVEAILTFEPDEGDNASDKFRFRASDSAGFFLENGSSNETSIKALFDGDVELYYDNSKKFETTSYGGLVSGNLDATGNFVIPNDTGKFLAGASNDLQIYHDGSNSFIDNSTGGLFVRANTIKLRDAAGNEDYIEAFQNGAVRLYYDNTLMFRTYASGVIGDQNIWVGSDNYKLLVGGSADLEIFHDGSHSNIKNNTGNLRLQCDAFRLNSADNSENIIKANKDGAVELYHDGTARFQTLSNGCEVLGRLGVGDGTNPETSFQVTATAAGAQYPMLLKNRTNGNAAVGMRFIASGADLSDGDFASIEAGHGAVNTTNHEFRFKTCSGGTVAEKLRIQAGGGISFNGDSAAANALDDFEEGTWTPTAQYNTGSHVAVANAVCRYVKIGSLVHVSGRFSLTSDANGGSGELRIGGLPFTKNNPGGDGNSAGIQIYVEGAASNITNDIVGLTLDGDTQFLIRRSGTTSSGNDFVGLVDAGTTLLVGGTYMSGQ